MSLPKKPTRGLTAAPDITDQERRLRFLQQLRRGQAEPATEYRISKTGPVTKRTADMSVYIMKDIQACSQRTISSSFRADAYMLDPIVDGAGNPLTHCAHCARPIAPPMTPWYWPTKKTIKLLTAEDGVPEQDVGKRVAVYHVKHIYCSTGCYHRMIKYARAEASAECDESLALQWEILLRVAAALGWTIDRFNDTMPLAPPLSALMQSLGTLTWEEFDEQAATYRWPREKKATEVCDTRFAIGSMVGEQTFVTTLTDVATDEESAAGIIGSKLRTAAKRLVANADRGVVPGVRKDAVRVPVEPEDVEMLEDTRHEQIVAALNSSLRVPQPTKQAGHMPSSAADWSMLQSALRARKEEEEKEEKQEEKKEEKQEKKKDSEVGAGGAEVQEEECGEERAAGERGGKETLQAARPAAGKEKLKARPVAKEHTDRGVAKSAAMFSSPPRNPFVKRPKNKKPAGLLHQLFQRQKNSF